ncbi:MAG: hormogonium polysaccharide biosynthesis glycosyltransferase HpsE [Phormidesmis sp.]
MSQSDRPSRSSAGTLATHSQPTAGKVSAEPTQPPDISDRKQSLKSPAARQSPVLDITVAIPTYNGAARLPLLLEQLRSQTSTDPIRWEIIVCDNNSSDDTRTIVRQYQANWPTEFPLRYKFAAQQGAAFARQRAVEAANGQLIAFLDDDNVPTEDWIAEAYQFACTHPQAGVFGSQIHGKFESDLPHDLESIKCFLAIIERGDRPHLYEPATKMLPPAAGLVVRKDAWLQAVPKRLFLNNKGKSAGLASEDLEAILHIQKSGWQVWYNPDMVVYHHIPDSRIEKDYLVTLLRCVGLSRAYIRMLGIKPWKRPLAIPAYIANDVYKLLLHWWRYGQTSQLGTVDSCDRELLTSTLASPFFLLKKVFQDSLQNSRDRQHIDQQYWLEQIAQAFEQDRFILYQQPVVVLGPGTGSESEPGTGEEPSPTTDDKTENRAASLPITPSCHQKELLLRLCHKSDERAIASQFLSTAQRYGLMRTVDRWVIRHLTEKIQATPHLLIPSETESIKEGSLYSINLSQDSLTDQSLVQFISDKLSQADLSPHLFCFEISAASAIAFPEQSRSLATDLHHLGCQLTLEDASLSQATIDLIRQLPFDYIKIAASTLQKMEPSRRRLWAQLYETAQTQSTQIIATGIESSSLLQAAQEKGISYAQGYQIGQPQPL